VKFLIKNANGKSYDKNLKPVMVTVMVMVKRFYHFTITITITIKFLAAVHRFHLAVPTKVEIQYPGPVHQQW
jgi:hypothetical protein